MTAHIPFIYNGFPFAPHAGRCGALLFGDAHHVNANKKAVFTPCTQVNDYSAHPVAPSAKRRQKSAGNKTEISISPLCSRGDDLSRIRFHFYVQRPICNGAWLSRSLCVMCFGRLSQKKTQLFNCASALVLDMYSTRIVLCQEQEHTDACKA